MQKAENYIVVGDDGVDVVKAFEQESATMKLVRTGAQVAMAYHGYKRTGSVLWALGWGLAGGFAPIVAVPIAVAQGFGKKKGGK